MALRGLKVIEMAGLAPGPFCGMVLSDFGARVIRVDRTGGGGPTSDILAHGKESIAVNMKHAEGVNVIRKLCKSADVLVEPFRAGVMEKLGLGPSVLMKENSRLIYARLTGYGQEGVMAARAGHDINYLAIAGVLGQLGRAGEKPYFPVNILADMAGGGMTCAMGILLALLERNSSGKGQVIDANMVEGSAYISSFLWKARSRMVPVVGEDRGTGILDGGGAFYDTYETKDGKYMAVGAIEPQFYQQLIKGLGLTHDEAPQMDDQVQLSKQFTKIFMSKTQTEWCKIFDDVDACVTPVLSWREAAEYPHNKGRGAFMPGPGDGWSPCPAPTLTRTPAISEMRPMPDAGQHTNQVLQEIGFTKETIENLCAKGVLSTTEPTAKL